MLHYSLWEMSVRVDKLSPVTLICDSNLLVVWLIYFYMQVKSLGESVKNGIGQALMSAIVASLSSGERTLTLVLHPKNVRILLYNDSRVQLAVDK